MTPPEDTPAPLPGRQERRPGALPFTQGASHPAIRTVLWAPELR